MLKPKKFKLEHLVCNPLLRQPFSLNSVNTQQILFNMENYAFNLTQLHRTSRIGDIQGDLQSL